MLVEPVCSMTSRTLGRHLDAANAGGGGREMPLARQGRLPSPVAIAIGTLIRAQQDPANRRALLTVATLNLGFGVVELVGGSLVDSQPSPFSCARVSKRC